MCVYPRPMSGAALALLLLAAPLAASQVEPLTASALADHAGQVIVGRVAEVRSHWAENPRRIASEVRFTAVEYLKGALPDSTAEFALTVPGGTVGETRMEVCCAPQFAVGERWILFLLPTYRTFPVVGLYQGAFLLAADEQGTERVYYRRHGQREAVLALHTAGLVQVADNAGSAANSSHPQVVGAEHARLQPAATAPAPGAALTAADFLALLRPILATSRAHELTAPAGQPLHETLRAVPLVQATGAATAPVRPLADGATAAPRTPPPSRPTAPLNPGGPR